MNRYAVWKRSGSNDTDGILFVKDIFQVQGSTTTRDVRQQVMEVTELELKRGSHEARRLASLKPKYPGLDEWENGHITRSERALLRRCGGGLDPFFSMWLSQVLKTSKPPVTVVQGNGEEDRTMTTPARNFFIFIFSSFTRSTSTLVLLSLASPKLSAGDGRTEDEGITRTAVAAAATGKPSRSVVAELENGSRAQTTSQA